MRIRAQRCICILLAVFFVFGIMPLCSAQQNTIDYDKLRTRWVERLTGGDYTQTGEVYQEYILPKVNSAANTGKKWNDAMVKPESFASLGYLWPDLQMGDTMNEYTRKARPMSQSFERIEDMALAYRMKGSAMEGNAALKSNIIAALEYMYTAKYNEKTPRTNRNLSPKNPDENWYEWEIRAPEALVNILALMYGDISQSLIDNLLKAVDKQVPEIGAAATGANRLDNCLAAIVGGIVQKNEKRMMVGVEGIRPELTYSIKDDGFYEDGSFIQHHQYPYNGGYGLSALSSLTEIANLFSVTPYLEDKMDISPLYRWVYDSFLPLQYEGRMMDSVRGRGIASRTDTGYGLMETLVVLCQFAPPEDAQEYASAIKRWCERNGVVKPNSMNSIFTVTKLCDILNDSTVAPRTEQSLYKNFGAMDRAVMRRENFAFQISMYSDRIRNYESINGANLRGWHTASGALYLYNDDLDQYTDDYWPTVDSHRLAGTTVIKGSTAPSAAFGDSFAGGVEIDGKYGVNAMRYRSTADAAADGGASHNLTAQKAWFALDDEIVCLGSGITSSVSGDAVETVVENRKVDSASCAVSVNGVLLDNAAVNPTGVQTVHIKGNTAHVNGAKSTDLAYYFPQPADLTVKREKRTDSWRSIGGGGSTAMTAREYVSLALEHGTQPQNAGYAYAILPGKTADELQRYAQNPNFMVLSNTKDLQMVRKKDSGLLCGVVWTGGQQVGNLTCNAPSLVMVEETEELVKISVSDPRQTDGELSFVWNGKAAGALYADTGACVIPEGDRTRIVIETTGALGKTFHITLSKKEIVNSPNPPQSITANALSPTAVRVIWAKSAGAEKYYLIWSETENGTYTPVPRFDGMDTEYVHRLLTPGKTYYYKAALRTEAGISEYSSPVQVTLPQAVAARSVQDIYDDFESYPAGPLQYQNDWQIKNSPEKYSFVEVVEEGGNARLKVAVERLDSAGKSAVEVSKTLIPTSDIMVAEGDFQIPDNTWKNLILLQSGNTVAVQVYANSSKLWTYDGPQWNYKGEFQDFVFQPDRTYHIKAEVDIRNQSYRVYVDGDLMTFQRNVINNETSPDGKITRTDIPFRNRVSSLNKYACSISDTTGTFYIDNLSVTPNTVQVFDRNGERVHGALNPGEPYTMRMSYLNRSESAQTPIGILRLRDAAGRTTASVAKFSTIGAGQRGEVESNITLPRDFGVEITEGNVFFWTPSDLQPLSAPISMWVKK